MWLALLSIGLVLLAVGLFGITEFNADPGLRLRGAILMAGGLALILMACFSLA
jgi:hypothetical protein